MKNLISILGSTGSIGLSSLEIIDKRKSSFKINLLSANVNLKLICKQIIKYKPNYFIINDNIVFNKVKKKFKRKKTIILNNFDNLKSFKKNDITIAAIPGIAGLSPTIKMIKYSKKLLIANKESIICGWELIKKDSIKYKTKLIPVDSEHFSTLKLLEQHNIDNINKIYITASGGPFLRFKLNQFRKITPKQALKHPKWKMGKKISIDSATLMNKILELIEAQKLFDIPNRKIDVLIHPNSLVHSIIELKNGLTHFIYHETSMLVPLANAMFDGNLDIKGFLNPPKKKILQISNLVFEPVNEKLFPVIKLKKRINEHPSTPIIINATNEILVDQFLKKKIAFLTISKTIITILNNRNYKKYAIRTPKNIYQIKEIDTWARKTTINYLA